MELRKYTATNGKVFKRKGTEMTLSEILYLGKEDNIENYEQVEKENNESS